LDDYEEAVFRKLLPFQKQQGILNEDGTTYVKPNISIICDSGKVNGKKCTGVPNWIMEILSPGSRRMGIADLKISSET